MHSVNLSCNPQLGIAAGFDHNFILHRRWAGLVRVATLHEPRSGRVLEVSIAFPLRRTAAHRTVSLDDEVGVSD